MDWTARETQLMCSIEASCIQKLALESAPQSQVFTLRNTPESYLVSLPRLHLSCPSPIVVPGSLGAALVSLATLEQPAGSV